MVFRNGFRNEFCNGFCHETMGFRHRFRNMAFVLCNRLIGFRNRSAERTADGWEAKRAGLIQFLHDRLPFTMLKIKPHCVSTRKAAGMGRGWKNGHCETARLAPTRPACHRQEQCCIAFHGCGYHCNSFQIARAIQSSPYVRFLGCRLLFGNNARSPIVFSDKKRLYYGLIFLPTKSETSVWASKTRRRQMHQPVTHFLLLMPNLLFGNDYFRTVDKFVFSK